MAQVCDHIQPWVDNTVQSPPFAKKTLAVHRYHDIFMNSIGFHIATPTQATALSQSNIGQVTAWYTIVMSGGDC